VNILSSCQWEFRAIEKPAPSEYSSASARYIDLVPDDRPVLDLLKRNGEQIIDLFLSLPPGKLSCRYHADKWTLREVLVHLTDDERIYAYRALRFARNDQQQLKGFDQDAYTQFGEAGKRELAGILDEYAAVRWATLALFQGLPEAALTRMGSTNENKFSVRALLYHLTGHEINHLRIIREKYLA
jgi:uncharacterized damage-inducible protein DinB